MATYRERLNPPLSWMSFIFFMYFSMAFAIWAAFDFLEALIFLIVLSATLPYLWIKMRMVITVDTELRIDRAHIELKYLKEPREIDETEYRKLRTFNSDARSFHATRPWLKRGVQVFVNDDRDKTSYWLIGSNNAGELVKRIRGIQP
ncbi:MAG: hypothetical protein RL579_780 [Actinomycetota bacterium]|jgi:hypothetical protein